MGRGRQVPRPASRAVYRRRRLGVGLGLVVAVAAIATLTHPGASATRARGARPPAGNPHATQPAAGRLASLDSRRKAAGAPAAAEAGLLPWQLQAPISREVVLPTARPGQLLIAGGLTASGATSNGVFHLSTSSGQLSELANLDVATHDAAGAAVAGGDLVLGGGSTAPSATTQEVAAGGSTTPGTLPGARADSSAVTIGRTAYVVGGYDGTAMDPEVLATTDGRSFRRVAALPVPVRYAAVAAVGGKIFVFGGETLAGVPVDTIQVVDPARHDARVLGHLPVALGGASAAAFGDAVYLTGGAETSTKNSYAVYAFDTSTSQVLLAGRLRTAVAYAGSAVTAGRLWIVGGELADGSRTAAVQVVNPDRAFGTAGLPGAGSPYFGDKLLIADRGNDRLLVLSDTGAITWRYPSAGKPAPPGGFYFPDDAFFIRHGTAIISNQEENETIVEIAYPSGKLLWQYGHPRQPGYAPGYLDNPDDAYLLRNGDISVADPVNCRVLVIDPKTKTVLHQIGVPRVCTHQPPTYLGSPNGDTPLPDGNLLVSEINGSWIDEYTTSGKLVWTVQLPSVAYPSDPQRLGPDRYLVADYSDPGAFVEFNRAGRILYRYAPASGTGTLNMPSLVEQLPSGVLMANDDHNDRIVAIDPRTGALVWQYGVDGVPGTKPGYLFKPDGFDILAPGGTTPTHTATG